ncbi:DUF2452 domain-containing protein [Croceimicrobium hydrocarbonivorans]|uniref:DUF2452 domain-containing protein n=1 Tax=Croceimicrobium hydrocarbonivorans TaxID=2761580 RepID=A0A7H0VCP8_9FLAO|nr:DUF2452 domain-containing protein [Croceimicrobium hydrocarbonivorans]QNR23496.1 DUF2452 domain-containing protein [Croceimicrobium hydrocarbonivorans]
MADKKAKENKDFVNPIDPDKITENPSTLPYAHTVGGAVIKPTKQGVIRSRALTAMEEQTDMQLAQIKEQIDLLARQAHAIQERKDLAARIYEAKMGFKPEINHIYHLYLNHQEQHVLSMIAPDEWLKPKFKRFLYTVKLLADHTWEVLASGDLED